MLCECIGLVELQCYDGTDLLAVGPVGLIKDFMTVSQMFSWPVFAALDSENWCSYFGLFCVNKQGGGGGGGICVCVCVKMRGTYVCVHACVNKLSSCLAFDFNCESDFSF